MEKIRKSKSILISTIVALFLTVGILYFTSTRSSQPSQAVAEDTSGEAAVVSAHQLATEAGFEALEAGGTAADAAVAVAATLSVVEPWFSSALGGGTWALYYEAETGEVTSLDGVGPVGSEATLADYSRRSDELDMNQAIVPGAWDGWMLWLERYGRLDLDEVLAPAIEVAREGYEVSEGMSYWLDQEDAYLIPNREYSRAIYMPDGEILEEGDIVYQRDMADTFESLANAYEEAQGGRSAAIQAARDYFYRGPIAEAIVEFSRENGGYLTLEDFHNFEARIVEPISIEYGEGIEVFQNPPNSQGITMLLALNILKDYDFSGLAPSDPEAVHMQAEAAKLAFADRYYHVGDPERVEVPVAELLSDSHADRQRERIDMSSAQHWPITDGLEPANLDDAHTTTFHIVDKHGNAAAVTTSLGAQFLVVGDTGIHINNRMRMLSLEEGNPNQLTPGYKVRHTSNPYMALRGGLPHILGGNTGIDTQPQGQMQQFISVVEFGLSPQEAVARPRFITTSFPSSVPPYSASNTLQMENGFSQDLVEELEALGHSVEVGTGVYGSANMLVIGEDGKVQVGAEPRDTSYGYSTKN